MSILVERSYRVIVEIFKSILLDECFKQER